MSVVMRLVTDDDPPLYVRAYSPHGFGGRGYLETTTDIEHARKFADHGEALIYYRQVSSTHPKRGDGKPNRPLTAFTVEIMAVSNEAKTSH